MKWILSNKFYSKCLPLINDFNKQELNKSFEKQKCFKENFQKNNKFEWKIKCQLFIFLIDQICDEVQNHSRLLQNQDNKLLSIFEGTGLRVSEIRQICFNQKFYLDQTLIVLKKLNKQTNDFSFLENINSNEQGYLQKYMYIQREDVIASKVDTDILGLILWIAPFTDQILDVIYLITGEFYLPLFFYLYLCSFFASLLGVIIDVFYGVYEQTKNKSPGNNVSTRCNCSSFPFIKTSLISICTWLRIEEFIYLLGYRKFIRNHFYPEIDIGYENFQFVYNDPQKLSKQQRKHQKIELYLENIIQFVILVLNQTLLNDWNVFNMAQSCLSYTLIIISIFKFYVKDNYLQINGIKNLLQYLLIKFGHANKIIGMIYAITVLCVNLIALNELDQLNISSDLTNFKPKFQQQIKFAIIAIVIDVFHFLFFIFIFKSNDNKNDLKALANSCTRLRIPQILQIIMFLYFTLIDYFLYAIFQVTYSYFEIKMYHTFNNELSEADKLEFGIMRFRFSYFMLIIFCSTYISHPLIYVPLALYEIFLFIIVMFLYPIVYLLNKCRVDIGWLRDFTVKLRNRGLELISN